MVYKMDKKELGKYFAFIVSAMLLSVGANELLNNDEPVTLYGCESTGVISDCVNGIKACNEATGICTRCYYDADNGRKYKNCAEGWQENFITQDIPSNEKAFRSGSYQCNTEGCLI